VLCLRFCVIRFNSECDEQLLKTKGREQGRRIRSRHGAQDEAVDLNVGKIFCKGLAVLNEKCELGVWLACTTAKPEEQSKAKVR